MRTTIIGASILLGSVVTAQAQTGKDDSGFYIGLGIGRASIDGTVDDQEFDLSFDDTENVYAARVGYMANNWVGFELGYYNFDEYNELASQFVDGISFGDAIDTSLDLDAYTAALVLNAPINVVDIYAKGGIAYLDGTASAQLGPIRVEESDSFTEPYGVVGAELDFGKVNLFTEYTRIFDTDDLTVDFVSGGIKYEF